MWFQKEIRLKVRTRGFHLITEEILQQLPELKEISVGMLNVRYSPLSRPKYHKIKIEAGC